MQTGSVHSRRLTKRTSNHTTEVLHGVIILVILFKWLLTGIVVIGTVMYWYVH
jgi:hypothetical protein